MDLWQIAEEEAHQAGLGIANDCASLLRGVFAQAPQPDRVNIMYDPKRDVELNTHMLVRTMIAIAKERGYSELHEDTFRDAMIRICPLFPFC